MTPLDQLPLGTLCLDFVNTWGDRDRPASDQLRSYRDVLSFGRQAGVLDLTQIDALEVAAADRPESADAALDGARQLRDWLYVVLSTCAAAGEPDRIVVETLSSKLAEALSHLRLEPVTKGGFRYGFERAEDLESPLWPVLRDAAELLTSEDLGRVRECGGAHCTWLFLDKSRNRSRRWCDMASCGNRAKARRHYQRRVTGAVDKGGPSADPPWPGDDETG